MVSTMQYVWYLTKKKQCHFALPRCSKWFRGIHFCSGDTDIMVLSVWLLPSNEERVFLDYGNGKNCKAIKLCNVNIRYYLKRALLGFHTFTRNDYVLMFFTKGKAVSWKKMVKNGMFIKGLQELGLSWKSLMNYLKL